MKDLAGRVAVITGAGTSRLHVPRNAAARSPGLLYLHGGGFVIGSLSTHDRLARELAERLAARTVEKFGAAHLLFNNAGVAAGGGFVWEVSLKDWQWVMSVNLMGVVHGIRSFVPLMLKQDCECHVVNTASAAGLVSAPLMAAYNASKHGVVTVSETLFHDLRAANAKVGVSVLCPAYVPTNIRYSERNRPAELTEDARPTPSQTAARERSTRAVASGRLSAAEVARMTFDAVRENRFYVVTHPKMLASVELRLQDIVAQRSPTDPYTFKPDLAFKPR